MTFDLIPRPPRHKKQPTAEKLREQLRLAADEIIRLRATPPKFVRCTHDTRSWWRRLLGLSDPATDHLHKRYMDSIVPPNPPGGYQPVDDGKPVLPPGEE